MSCSFICTKRVLLTPCFMESARICGAGFRFSVLQVCREMKWHILGSPQQTGHLINRGTTTSQNVKIHLHLYSCNASSALLWRKAPLTSHLWHLQEAEWVEDFGGYVTWINAAAVGSACPMFAGVRPPVKYSIYITDISIKLVDNFSLTEH